MNGAVFVAIAASIGNLLQGWDNATIAGAVLYIKREFNLESQPTMEGLIVAMSLIGATIITTFSGAAADWLGRRPLLILSSALYFVSGLVMFWSPNVYILLLARLIDGFGVGLAVTLVPIYISETAPPDIRGSLNTLPQFAGSVGMFVSYCMVFGMSLMPKAEWRLMLGLLSIPSLVYFLLMVLFLPESPRWLVSKGKMEEAKLVLQKLREQEDVSGEMALLVEGLEVGDEIAIEKYIIGPATELTDEQAMVGEKDHIKHFGAEEGVSWIARPVTGQSTIGIVSRHGSMENQNQKTAPLVDPLVTLFGSVHENLPETMGSMRSMLFPNFGSMFSVAADNTKTEEWDEESVQPDGEEYASDADRGNDSEDNIHSPLLSRQTTSMEKDMVQPQAHGSIFSIRNNSNLMQGNAGESLSTTDIGGGWQLAWKWTEQEGVDGKDGGLKRIYMHQEGTHGSRRGSLVSLPGGDVPAENEFVQAAALVSQSVLYTKDMVNQLSVGLDKIRPAAEAVKGPRWSDLFESGVKHALIVGIGIQILQQDNIHSPLLSRQTTSMEKDMVQPQAHGSIFSIRNNSNLMQGNAGESLSTTDIGGGWQLAWKWTEQEGVDGKDGGLKRIYMHQEGTHGSRRGSLVSLPGGDVPAENEFVQAAALVSQSVLYTKDMVNQLSVGLDKIRPAAEAVKGPRWSDLFESGVKHALIVGIGIQILQQFAGINGVLYYTPQILEQAGVEVLLSDLGISSDSASFLISAFTTLLMLPCIAVAMRLMDISGRRRLLLTTIPILIVSLIILVISNVIVMSTVLHAVLSTFSVILYFCCFVMGFGPIPNILCSEIFPTRVRGVCIAICALTFWIGDIIVTYSLPVMLNSIGLAGVFGIYAIVCVLAMVFVYARVPETKGMPLEVISEFFSVGTKKTA